MRLDYELIWGLEEWKDNGYKITKDFCRLKVYTERMARFLCNETGKDIPGGSVIKLTYDEMRRLDRIITGAKEFTGLFGAHRAYEGNTENIFKKEYDWWEKNSKVAKIHDENQRTDIQDFMGTGRDPEIH